MTGDTKLNAKLTKEFLRTTAIVASRTGRTITDVSERIRSGFLGSTEAIEDLGILVNVSMLESTEAFKRFAGDKSWGDLDEKTKQTIRAFAILEQASNNLGDEIQQGAMLQLTQLTATFKDAALVVGQGLMPALQSIMPLFQFLGELALDTARDFRTFMDWVFGVDRRTINLNKTKNDSAKANEKEAASLKKVQKAATSNIIKIEPKSF